MGRGRSGSNKPMEPGDYEKVEHELQKQLMHGRVQQQTRLQSWQDLSDQMTTHSLDDSDEEELYFDLVGSHHSGSSVHSMESSFSSTTTGKSTSTMSSKFHEVQIILRHLCLQYYSHIQNVTFIHISCDASLSATDASASAWPLRNNSNTYSFDYICMERETFGRNGRLLSKNQFCAFFPFLFLHSKISDLHHTDVFHTLL